MLKQHAMSYFYLYIIFFFFVDRMVFMFFIRNFELVKKNKKIWFGM